MPVATNLGNEGQGRNVFIERAVIAYEICDSINSVHIYILIFLDKFYVL